MLKIWDRTMWGYVAADMMKELKFLPIAILLGGATYLMIRLIARRKNRKRVHLFMALFLIYLFALINITLLERDAGSRTGISLKIFETLGDARANAYVIENVLLFIPFGVLTAFLWRPMRNILISMIAGAACSLGIEVIQLVTQRGHFQVDDIITNCLGTGLGVFCFWLLFIPYRVIRSGRHDNG